MIADIAEKRELLVVEREKLTGSTVRQLGCAVQQLLQTTQLNDNELLNLKKRTMSFSYYSAG